MKHLIVVLALATLAGTAAARTSHAAPASAADGATATQPGTPQRTKMKTCNADAKTRNLHGDDRRAFMSQCLSGKAKPAKS